VYLHKACRLHKGGEVVRRANCVVLTAGPCLLLHEYMLCCLQIVSHYTRHVNIHLLTYLLAWDSTMDAAHSRNEQRRPLCIQDRVVNSRGIHTRPCLSKHNDWRCTCHYWDQPCFGRVFQQHATHWMCIGRRSYNTEAYLSCIAHTKAFQQLHECGHRLSYSNLADEKLTQATYGALSTSSIQV
jgi:hypothetical protein